MKPAATFVAGVAAGILLALLLTSNATSRTPSAPRPAATILATLRPVAPLRTGAPTPGVGESADSTSSRSVEWPRKSSSSASHPPDHGANSTGADGAETAGDGASPSPTTRTGPASVEPAADPIPSAAPTPKPKRTTRPSDGRRGVASYVRASLGADYLASRLPRGTRLRICGPVGCVRGTVNDYGPSKRIHPERIVDLSAADFTRVCGPLSIGVCRVTVGAVQ